MIKKGLYIITGLILSIVLFFISLYIFNEPILKKSNLGPLKTLTTVFFPPNDLYRPLVSTPIESLEISNATILNFKNKYSGRHGVAISIGKDEKMFDFTEIAPELTLKLDFYSEEGDLLLSRAEKNGWSYLGAKDIGYVFMTYDAPSGLPLGLALRCEVTVLNVNSELNNNSSKLNLIIKKISDL